MGWLSVDYDNGFTESLIGLCIVLAIGWVLSHLNK